MRKQEQGEALVSLADLALAGVKVTVVASRKARRSDRQKMRSKNSGGYVVGGHRPGSVKAASFGL